MEVRDNGWIHVDREACELAIFDKEYGKISEDPQSSRYECQLFCNKHCECSRPWITQKILGFLPFIEVIRTYKWKQWLGRDIISGLSMGVVHLPQGMGFAILTGVAPVFGLYSSFWPVLFYFLFGTSRHISMGTMAIISIVLTAPVERAAERFLQSQAAEDVMPGNESLGNNGTMPAMSIASLEEEEQNVRAQTAALVTLIVGLIQILMGIMRLGFVTTFMPTPFVSGFTTGAAFHITTSQVTGLLGLKVKRVDGLFKLPLTWYEIAKSVPNTNLATMTVGLVCLTWLILIKEVINEKCKKHMKIPVPAELILVITGTVCSYFLHLSERYKVSTVGYIPTGLPPPSIPPLDHAKDFMVDAIIAAILSFAISVSLANLFSEKYRYNIDPNQEFIAYGLSHALGACFGCFAGAAAPPRCFVHDQTGGKSQVAGLVSCMLLLLILLAIGNLFQFLPIAVLSAVIVVAIFPLFKQFRDPKNYWVINGVDTCVWIITWSSVVFLNIDIGLGIGMMFSVITVVCQSMSAKGFVLAAAGKSGLYVPASKYNNTSKTGHICVFKFDSNLYFASIKNFKKHLFAATVDPQKMSCDTVLDNNNTQSVSCESSDSKVVVNEKVDPAHVNLGIKSNGAHSAEIYVNEYPETETAKAKQRNAIKVIVLDCSAFTYIDIMGVSLLRRLLVDYSKIGVTLALADCGSDIEMKLKKAGIVNTSGGSKLISKPCVPLYPSVHDAVISLESIHQGYSNTLGSIA